MRSYADTRPTLVDDSSGRAGDRPTLLGMSLVMSAQEAADILGVIASG